MNNIGTAIKLGRVKKGMKQKDLAEKLDVTCSAIGFWETGKRIPSGDTLIKIAQELDIIDDLFSPSKTHVIKGKPDSTDAFKAIQCVANRVDKMEAILKELVKKNDVDEKTEDAVRLDDDILSESWPDGLEDAPSGYISETKEIRLREADKAKIASGG